MNKIEISKFRAFKDQLSIELNKKNLLVYGDNGAGKSSIYDALKVIFFRSKISSTIPTDVTPEEYQQLTNDLWASYNNTVNSTGFELKINDFDYISFSKTSYNVFMLSLPELSFKEEIYLPELLSKFYFDITDIDIFCEKEFELIEADINQTLELFKEKIKIEISKEDGYSIKIIDQVKNLERKKNLRNYFNEGKLNLIVLLILFCTIQLNSEKSKTNIVILDDFITSLDIANRTFLVRYLLKEFKYFQIIIFTHNITFYNLIMFTINEVSNTQNEWIFANLYEIRDRHIFYSKDSIEKVDDIKNDYNNNSLTIEQIGNKIRKKFEILLYEFSKVLLIGGVEDSKKIIERIVSGKPLYFNKNKTVHDLVEKIDKLIQGNGDKANFFTKTKDFIGEYKKSEYRNLEILTRDLKLYQKVSMHPLSHGTFGLSTFTIKEIEESLDLLEKMENILKSFVDKNVYSA